MTPPFSISAKPILSLRLIDVKGVLSLVSGMILNLFPAGFAGPESSWEASGGTLLV
jgi:hypothetical protein